MSKKFFLSNLLLGVTGSVGVLIVPHYIKLLRDSFAEKVHVMMSYSAQKFITPYTMRLFSGNYVFTNTFNMFESIRVPHVQLTEKCDLFLVMPATANIIGKVANGICDDLISTAAIASKAPLVFVPSMSPNMWYSKANQKNIFSLKELGHFVVPPSEGYAVADMKSSFGGIPEFDTIVDFIKQVPLTRN